MRTTKVSVRGRLSNRDPERPSSQVSRHFRRGSRSKSAASSTAKAAAASTSTGRGAARPKRHEGATDERLWATSEPVRRRVRATITGGIADDLQGVGVDGHSRASAERDVVLVAHTGAFHQLRRWSRYMLLIEYQVLGWVAFC